MKTAKLFPKKEEVCLDIKSLSNYKIISNNEIELSIVKCKRTPQQKREHKQLFLKALQEASY